MSIIHTYTNILTFSYVTFPYIVNKYEKWSGQDL